MGTGHAYDWQQERLNRIRSAMAGSELTLARVLGMKARAKFDPPQAAQGGFPYPARTCAEWTPLEAKHRREAENA